jgi:hypothetical protein
MDEMKILLIEPNFPIPKKSKNHKDFLPIGLLKLASYYRSKGHEVKLIRGLLTKAEIKQIRNRRWNHPDRILITSLFTYWKQYVVDCVNHYHHLFPSAHITIGGIYASLMTDDCKSIPFVNNVHVGVHKGAEMCEPAYDLIAYNPHPLDYQIIHTSRGCPRKCNFCGTWKIEPQFVSKSSIRSEVFQRKLVFYDNNLLLNPHIEDILDELIEMKQSGQILWCESQSGFDGRVLMSKPHLAMKIKQAGFKDIRIAWDGPYSEHREIKKQLKILNKAGYRNHSIFMFMIFNWDIPFKEMEMKRRKCFDWNVQIVDCRNRPLNQTYDLYNPNAFKKGQTGEDYHIHISSGWNDALVRKFRKNIRRQNICIRQHFEFYSRALEHKKVSKEEFYKIMEHLNQIKGRREKKAYLRTTEIDYWFP